jgi:hypothetical protein
MEQIVRGAPSFLMMQVAGSTAVGVLYLFGFCFPISLRGREIHSSIIIPAFYLGMFFLPCRHIHKTSSSRVFSSNSFNQRRSLFHSSSRVFLLLNSVTGIAPSCIQSWDNPDDPSMNSMISA